MDKIGVVTEQGDLGLGFNPVSEDDEKILNENKKSKDTETEKK